MVASHGGERAGADGPRRLVDWPWVVVEVECSPCRRRGRYRLARLAERHGAGIDLAALLRALAGRCGLNKPGVAPRPDEARCGARYRVPAGGPLPDGAPAREARSGERWPPRPRRLGPEGPLPTVGGALAEGRPAVLVYCIGRLRSGYPCHHRGRVPLAALGLPPDLPFIDIPRARRLRCSRCGSRAVEVRTEWPDRRDTSPPREVNGILLPRSETAGTGGGLHGVAHPRARQADIEAKLRSNPARL